MCCKTTKFTSAAKITTSICDEDRSQQHPPFYVHFTLHLFLSDCEGKDVESLNLSECVKWQRWTKSDLINTWRNLEKCFVSLFLCVWEVCMSASECVCFRSSHVHVNIMFMLYMTLWMVCVRECECECVWMNVCDKCVRLHTLLAVFTCMSVHHFFIFVQICKINDMILFKMLS